MTRSEYCISYEGNTTDVGYEKSVPGKMRIRYLNVDHTMNKSQTLIAKLENKKKKKRHYKLVVM